MSYRIVADFIWQQKYRTCFGNLAKSSIRSLERRIRIGQHQVKERQNGYAKTNNVTMNAGDKGLAERCQGFDEFSEIKKKRYIKKKKLENVFYIAMRNVFLLVLLIFLK